MRRTICVLGLGLLLVAATIALKDPPAREPFDGQTWSVDSVTVLDEATTTTYAVGPPFRVVRGGRVTLARPADGKRLPAVRVDLTVDGEHVIVFAGLSQGSGHGSSH
jgi:hypothetical protein